MAGVVEWLRIPKRSCSTSKDCLQARAERRWNADRAALVTPKGDVYLVFAGNRISGSPVQHTSAARAQRGANEHPGGERTTLGGAPDNGRSFSLTGLNVCGQESACVRVRWRMHDIAYQSRFHDPCRAHHYHVNPGGDGQAA